MLVAECECGSEIEFVAEEGTTSPIRETCDCGSTYELKVRKVR